MSEQAKTNKTTAYLAAAGAFSFASFLVVTPFVYALPVIALAVVPVAIHPKREQILTKIGQDLKSLWSDLKIHATEDMNSLRQWWHSKAPAQKEAAPVATKTAEEPSTFNATATVKPTFEVNAQPGVEVKAEQKPTQKPVPAAKPNTPK
ncbi:MAG TPA: hypothetical protein VHP34_08420 [Alphaproteobacteria bacterium]|jgi:hypothetical protein|nr:hypothetical protein [Alphaproteobacteria bacterium]